MITEIEMEKGVAESFKSNMQIPFDFLSDCSASAKSCQILEDLGFDGGVISYVESKVESIKSSITSMLSSVGNCEADVLNTDQNCGGKIETQLALEEDLDEINNADTASNTTQTENVVTTHENTTQNQDSSNNNNSRITNTNTNINTNTNTNTNTDNRTTSQNSSSNNSGTTTNTTSNGNRAGTQSSNNNNRATSRNSNNSTNTSRESENISNNNDANDTGIVSSNNSYKFDFDRNTAYSNGDIFIDEKYNLTDFTNYILYKYNIKDENVAKAIYGSIINYGNKYYQTYHKNPITSVSEKEILSEVYKGISNIVANSDESTFWNMLKNI